MRRDPRQSFRSAALLFCLGSVLPAGADLLLVGGPGSLVFRFDSTTGLSLGSFGHTTESLDGVTAGPDGNIYVTSNVLGYGQVFRFKPWGEFLGVFASSNLRTPGALAFGPEGDLYVLGSNWPDDPDKWGVLRYNGASGDFVSWFVQPQTGSPTGMAFGADGKLYIADPRKGVLRCGVDGQLPETFIPAGSGGLANPSGLVFGPDDRLYIGSLTSNAVLRFDAKTGAFLDTFIPAGSSGLQRPRGMAFGPDGKLYVVSSGTRSVMRYAAETGEFLGTFASCGSDTWPSALAFTPELPRLSIARNGEQVEISWTAGTNDWVLSACRDDSADWACVETSPSFIDGRWVVRERAVATFVRYRLEHR